ncbi:SGNH/GDSL hydrolase family protein [Actinobacteria bacterium YIM 96077]|uniref:SGNH/GDSL hydrolase family protein n=1 Tax=Phytoactinopolyspora halophila TaxID=1981511 RepID=A0A329QKH0_9ACTN|nr:SGNH/GDSL hydrolase family protein [Phytoactinopolyspora halophila]AYY14375.1 SGNH/GDSL hydrolase family protein [Actinobacteria bacterium YIM 96077]RAW11902.1 SGNH/GDSL hydrolase family protein [Phytoactinopolyspora halophila]
MVGPLNAANVRRITTTAAAYGGGIGLLSASFYGLLRLQASLARRTITGVPLEEPPNADGVYGDHPGSPISFTVIGDSCAAGYGVHHPDEAPGALIAAGLAEIAEQPVRLTTVARGGARSADLADQVDRALVASPNAALIIIGGNDVTHSVSPERAVTMLTDAILRLRDAGCATVVGACPDLGTIKPIQPPLRWLARQWSRKLAAAQTIAAVEAGARTVSLGSILGPEFAASPRELFSEDQFHPSAAGYAHAAAAVLPSIAAGLGLWPADEYELEPPEGEGVAPISVAAATAAGHGGTEVAAATVDGREAGPRGPWAKIRRRNTSNNANVPPLPDASEDADDGHLTSA